MRDIISPEVDRITYMSGLFSFLKEKTLDIDADYGVENVNGKTYFVLDGQRSSIASLCVLHGHLQNAASENPEKWMFLIEDDMSECSPEEIYVHSLARILDIPVKNPVVHPYDRIAINKAVKEGVEQSDIYLALAVQNINNIPDMVELKNNVDKRIENFSKLWKLEPEYLKELIDCSNDEHNVKKFRSVNKKIKRISKYMGEISTELSSNRLARIIEKHSDKTNIFVNVAPEYTFLFNSVGVDIDSLFRDDNDVFEY